MKRILVYCVYWIHKKDHTDPYVEGYIGITSNFKERMRSHSRNKRRSHLVSAISKYGWDNLEKDIIELDLTPDSALVRERSFRPKMKIGWNDQCGGEIGVESSWYDDPENRKKHSLAISVAVRASLKNEVVGIRSERAILAHKNPDKYLDKYRSRGSRNGRAILSEEQVYEIKYSDIPSGMRTNDIALKYSVGKHVISFIKSGKNWSYI